MYVIRTFGGVLLINPPPVQYIQNVTWLTRDMSAAAWKTRDAQATWKTRDDVAAWKARG